MKSPVIVSLSAAGNTPWVPLNYVQASFHVSLAVLLTSGATLTYSVQHTYDEPGDDGIRRDLSIARAATVATVTQTAHKLSVADSVMIDGTGSSQLDCQLDSQNRPIAWDVASVVDANNFTYTVANAGPAASGPNPRSKMLRVFNHSVLVGLTARADSNYNFPPQAVRLKITAYTGGTADLIIAQGRG